MANSVKRLISILLLLFLAPIVIATLQTPLSTEQVIERKNEDIPIVYAAQIDAKPKVEVAAEVIPPKKALIYFTHWQEAFKPILAAKGEKIATYHQETNISAFEDQISAQFAFHQLEADFLEVDKPFEIKNYTHIRPYVKNAIENNSYDFIIDIHRDAAKGSITTLQVGEEKYAKVIFVIGKEHPNHKWNEEIAKAVSDEMNRLVPGISRGTLPKSGRGVDGVYNQDLDKNSMLLELGGPDNTEIELNRTIAILAKALSNVFNEQQLTS